MESLYNMEYIS